MMGENIELALQTKINDFVILMTVTQIHYIVIAYKLRFRKNFDQMLR